MQYHHPELGGMVTLFQTVSKSFLKNIFRSNPLLFAMKSEEENTKIISMSSIMNFILEIIYNHFFLCYTYSNIKIEYTYFAKTFT